jgi:hypothetical protein
MDAPSTRPLADVARDGFEAMMNGEERVVSASFSTKLQGRGQPLHARPRQGGDAPPHGRAGLRRLSAAGYAEPAARACCTAASTPPVHGSPWPVSTVVAPVAASASSVRRLRSTSAVAARATSRGPLRAV